MGKYNWLGGSVLIRHMEMFWVDQPFEGFNRCILGQLGSVAFTA